MSKQLVWFITGAAGGFGSHLTKIALARGDRVIASGRSLGPLKPFESESCKLLQLDVTENIESLKEKAAQAVGIWGRVDVLVNNAGGGGAGICEEAGAAGFQRLYNINFFGVINVTNAFLPHMRAARSGTIVIMGSRHAWMTRNAGLAPYNSCKAAIHAYGETLQAEIAQFNLKVLIPQPGAHRTNIIAAAANNSLFTAADTIRDYDPMRRAGIEKYNLQNGKQPGDPEKAMTAVVDVIRGEGSAKGRPMPLWLVLGTDAEENLREYLDNRQKNLEEYLDVTRSTMVDDKNFVLV